jgi:hypothetical protein
MPAGPFNQFVQDMEAAGEPVERYHGRFMWHGPAVRCSTINEFQRIVRETNVVLQWDSPLAYPVQSDEAWYQWAESNGQYGDEDGVEWDEGGEG